MPTDERQVADDVAMSEPNMTERDASILRSILVLAEALSPSARLWLIEWLQANPGEQSAPEDGA